MDNCSNCTQSKKNEWEIQFNVTGDWIRNKRKSGIHTPNHQWCHWKGHISWTSTKSTFLPFKFVTVWMVFQEPYQRWRRKCSQNPKPYPSRTNQQWRYFGTSICHTAHIVHAPQPSIRVIYYDYLDRCSVVQDAQLWRQLDMACVWSWTTRTGVRTSRYQFAFIWWIDHPSDDTEDRPKSQASSDTQSSRGKRPTTSCQDATTAIAKSWRRRRRSSPILTKFWQPWGKAKSSPSQRTSTITLEICKIVSQYLINLSIHLAYDTLFSQCIIVHNKVKSKFSKFGIY